MEQQEGESLGFCPDLQPDLSVGRALEWLLVGSQDVAHDLRTLHQLGVTHILNVAWGVPNAFPNVRSISMASIESWLYWSLFVIYYMLQVSLELHGTTIIFGFLRISKSS